MMTPLWDAAYATKSYVASGWSYVSGQFASVHGKCMNRPWRREGGIWNMIVKIDDEKAAAKGPLEKSR